MVVHRSSWDISEKIKIMNQPTNGESDIPIPTAVLLVRPIKTNIRPETK